MTNNDQTIMVAKSAPPVTVSGALLFGYPLQSWVLWATLIYTALNIFFIVRDKVYRPWKAKRNGQASND